MLRLHLLRHAKSSWTDPALDDHERPLAPRGRKAAKRLRRYTAEHDVRPRLVLCSTAVRALDTLERVLPGLGEPEVVTDDALYHASAGQLLARLRALPAGLAEVMIVGHNPALEDLLRALTGADALTLPTGALATLEADVGDWHGLVAGSALLRRLVLPRSLG